MGYFAYAAVAAMSYLLFSVDFLAQYFCGDQFRFFIVLFLASIILSVFVEISALGKVTGPRLKFNFSAGRVRVFVIQVVLLIVMFTLVTWLVNFVDLIDHIVYGLVIYFFVGALFESCRYLRGR